jgi:hypothetical protein
MRPANPINAAVSDMIRGFLDAHHQRRKSPLAIFVCTNPNRMFVTKTPFGQTAAARPRKQLKRPAFEAK